MGEGHANVCPSSYRGSPTEENAVAKSTELVDIIGFAWNKA